MNNPVAPVEGSLYLLFTEYENTTNIRKWSKKPFYGAQEYVPVGELERLRAALVWIEDCCEITSASDYRSIIEMCRDVAQSALEKEAKS